MTDRSGLLVRNLLNGGPEAGATGVKGSPGKCSPGSKVSEEGGKGKGKGKGKAEDAAGEVKEGEDADEPEKPVEEEVMGVAGTGYFRPGPMTVRCSLFLLVPSQPVRD